MGTTDSKQRLGEKVIEARKKLKEQRAIQSDRFQFFNAKSPETIKVIIDSIGQSFQECSPFLEQTLLIAWQSDAKQTQEIILKSCKKVLNAPIMPDEYQWFKKYVLSSSVWFYEISKQKYMFEELLQIVSNMSQEIIGSMNSIYSLFQNHPKWAELMNIKNETIISRQDDVKVGLLNEKGITDVLELKEEKIDEIQTFIDANLAVNILTTSSKQINGEFQTHMKNVMSRYGEVKGGPLKQIERCQSKIENDYPNAKFPKAAKLLDLVRCSVTFNTLDQLLDGYKGLMSHMKSNPSMVELARIKNGFLDPNYKGGYRDIKLNVVYHSPINTDVSMVCEVQLLLLNYLHEKKRIHKLYSIARQETYFQMVVKKAQQNQSIDSKNMKDLKFTSVLKVDQKIKLPDSDNRRSKCSVDTELGLLGMESKKYFICMDIKSKEIVFEQKVVRNGYERHSHNWIDVNGSKYVTLQTTLNTIKMFKVLKKNDKIEFKENESLQICCGKNDNIYYSEFDKRWENIFIVLNGNVFQQRSMKDVNTVQTSVTLEEKIARQSAKQLDVSNDGSWCTIGGGDSTNYFYIIDIRKNQQIKLTSKKLGSTFVPRFINGDTEYVAVGNYKIEIWDVAKRIAIKVIDPDSRLVFCMTATNNILAVCPWKGILKLYDVRNWEMFYSKEVGISGISIHLTSDSKYLTIGGDGVTKCEILEIE